MKIVKKIFAVTLCALVIVSVAVIPCFAWEWNGNNQLSAFAIAPSNEAYICNAPTYGNVTWTSNCFTCNASINAMFLDRSTPLGFTTQGTTITQGEANNSLSVYTADNMLWSADDIERLEGVYNYLRNNDNHVYQPNSTGLNGYVDRQFVNVEGLVQAQFSYIYSNNTDARYYRELFDVFATHYDTLPWLLSYTVYSATEEFKCGMNYELKFRSTAGEWTTLKFNDEIEPSLSYNLGSYYQHQFNIGAYLKERLDASGYSSDASPYVLVDSLQIGTVNSLRAIRKSYLCGVTEAASTTTSTTKNINMADAVTSSPVYISPVIAEPPTLDGLGNFLASAFGGFLSFEIFPGISLGGIFACIVGILVFVVFLKIFAGG